MRYSDGRGGKEENTRRRESIFQHSSTGLLVSSRQNTGRRCTTEIHQLPADRSNLRGISPIYVCQSGQETTTLKDNMAAPNDTL